HCMHAGIAAVAWCLLRDVHDTARIGKIVWRSQATLIADARGIVDVTQQAPRYGSYAGVHAMGLFWSMQPQKRAYPKATMWYPAGTSYTIRIIDAVANGKTVASTMLTRHFAAPGVKARTVHADGLAGILYTPASPGPHPAIIVMGGSEGGLYPQANEAALFASHGYVALALAYFQGAVGRHDPRVSKLPKMLVDIP